MVIKLGKLNVGPNHLLPIEIGENEGEVDDQLPDTDLFRLEAILDHLEEIPTLLTIVHFPEGYTAAQR